MLGGVRSIFGFDTGESVAYAASPFKFEVPKVILNIVGELTIFRNLGSIVDGGKEKEMKLD